MSTKNSSVIPQTQTPPPPPHYASPPISVVLTVVLLIFFFMGFFSIYFCKCFIQNLISVWQLRRNPSGIIAVTNAPPSKPGLDASLIQSFPTFTYSTVKGFRREKYGFECAICLAEFEDDDLLRLLTVCYHVFHQDCIDLWLESHKTCPVCRSDLDLAKESLEKPPDDHQNDGSALSDSISISIKDDNNDDDDDDYAEEITRGDGDHHPYRDQVAQNVMKRSEIRTKIDRFPRSHSTGHSIGRTNEEEEEEGDRHRLRLQEHVKIEITRGQHHSTVSCITLGEISHHHKNGGLGESSGFPLGDINKV